jgi:dipeptidase
MKLKTTALSFFSTVAMVRMDSVICCSDILVTPGASEDGSAMVAYNADDVSLFGYLYHYPPTQGKGDDMIQVYEWDSGVSKRSGSIV